MLLIGEQSPAFPKVSDFQALVASTTDSVTPLRQQCRLLFLINGKALVEMVELHCIPNLRVRESEKQFYLKISPEAGPWAVFL